MVREMSKIIISAGLNEKQLEVVDNIHGIYVVDAGAGTGKTTAITKRYERILEEAGDPNKILLLTFTDNAAENMRSKIIKECGSKYKINDLTRAPISTFHSFCNRLIKQNGLNSPGYLGIDGVLQNPAVMESGIYEGQFFRRFFNSFKAEHPQYNDVYKVIKYGNVLDLIRKLCCKGIFPKRNDWFNNSDEMLNGDFELYKQKFDFLNTPQMGKNNLTESKILKSFKTTFRDGFYISQLVDIFDEKQIKPEAAEIAFNDDRSMLMQFIHDIYFEYIQYCVKMNRINFDFMIMFAFILLYHNRDLRVSKQFDYVMVDEFQDTNEIQFMMVLMLMKTNNLCAVGDWKQGIYAFRNATIDNILEFDEKLRFYKEILNRDFERVTFDVTAVHREFDMNYRSSQEILDFSEKSLVIPATQDDFIDENTANRITHLNSAFDLSDKTKIEFFQAKDEDSEYGLILGKILDIVDNEDYLIKEIKNDEYVTRRVTFKDIAVLCRNRAFGLELQNRATSLGIPANYDGGIELFKTEPAILVLAWLRLVIDADNPRGWIPILEKEGYNYSQITYITRRKAFPKNLRTFREELVKEEKDIVSLIDKILKFHNFSGSHANAIIVRVQSLFSKFLIPVSELINFIEENIESGETYEIDINLSDDAFVIQTIHGAKGLEYPVVFIANVNQRRFPSLQTEKSRMFYHDLVGLRIRNEFGEKNGYKYVFDKWQTDLLATRLFSDYDEERRLLYVSITRAKQYLIFTSNPDASKFFDQMSEGHEVVKNYEPELPQIKIERSEIHDELTIGNYEKRGIVIGVHSLMKYKHPEDGGKGREFGNKLHSFAQKIALGIGAEWDQPEAERIKAFIASLNANELKTEVECSLPVGDNLIRGTIDLLALYDDRIEIIDYKSDLDYLNEEEYQKQLSIYYHVLRQVYQKKAIVCKLYYVCQDEVRKLEPLSIENMIVLSIRD